MRLYLLRKVNMRKTLIAQEVLAVLIGDDPSELIDQLNDLIDGAYDFQIKQKLVEVLEIIEENECNL
jgi:hypothetical protein